MFFLCLLVNFPLCVGLCVRSYFLEGSSGVNASFCAVGLGFRLFFCLFLCLSGFCCVGSSCFAAVQGCELGIDGGQIRSDDISVVGFPELEVSASLEKFAHTFGFFDTGHFNEDTSHLPFERLYVWLCYAEPVYTGAEHLV